MLSHFKRWNFVFLASLLLLACAQKRPSINRVQANALAKDFFVGDLVDPKDNPEFFMRVSVVDAAAGAGNDGLFTSSDAQPTTRIRWEISEELLLARLSYELIEDSDKKGARRVADGQIVAAYTIESHFDIRRDYNPSTGEELNVVVENSQDRLWHQREFFRVDWSRNLVTSNYELDTLAQLGIYYGVTWEPLAYYVNDPSHPDAPVFDTKAGYFDVTNKAWAKPELIEDPYWGSYPACWLVGAWPGSSCNPSEITLRQSFLKVGERDFEPLHWDGTRMEMTGLFTVDRFGYDRRYGVVDDKWHRFAARWNLYERSHAEPAVPCATPETTPVGADPNRDDGDGTEDECASVGRGSKCDRFVGACTVPLRDRVIQPVVWHVNRAHPEELFESSRLALEAWNDAARVAILAGRLAECRRTGEDNCEATHGWPQPWADDFVPPVGTGPAEVPNAFVLCHNPVDSTKGDDPSLCGPDGLSPRLGDLRYNLISVIDEPQATSPWGIMMDAEDPLSGEKISGSVNVWGARIDRAAAALVDLLALLNGQTDPKEFIQGKDLSDWVAANAPGGVVDKGRMVMSSEELQVRRQAFDPKVLTPYLAGLPKGKSKTHPFVKHKQRAQALVDGGRLGPGNAALTKRMQRLAGSALEARLITPEMAQFAGYNPQGPVSAETVKRASPFGRLNPAQRRAERRQRRQAQAQRHACRLEGPEPDGLIGLAKQAQKLFPAPDFNDPAAVNGHREQVYLWARQQLNLGVMAHELGHSMGLRHNFAGSFDSLNYAPQYWQLRTNHGAATADCLQGTIDGSQCVGPRWRDPISQQEIDGNIGRYATSSVMDYPGDQSQDMVLPGKYDRAAMRLAYGNVVDVWADKGLSVKGGASQQALAYKLTALSMNPGLFGVHYLPPVDVQDPYTFMHYSQYQNELGLIRDCVEDADAPLQKRCQQAPLDVVDYRDMSDFIDDPDYKDFSWAYTPKAVDPSGRVRRGYQFSSDEYADAGNIPSFSYDAGADAYEQVRFLESKYENRYVIDAFRRNRVQFNSFDATWSMQGRYHDNIQQIAKTFAFGALLEGDPAQPASELLQDGFYGPLELASTVALDMFARILTRPEPGHYCPAEDCYGVQPVGVDEVIHSADPVALPELYLYDFRVALGDGRYLHNDYDYSQGYWWGDYQTQVGAYYDKIWATYYLSEAYDYFISSAKEDFTDSRYKNVNFATVFPNQVRRLYNNLLTGDYYVYAPWVEPEADPDDTPLAGLRYPMWSKKEDLGERPGSALLVDPNYAWNEQIYAMVWGTMFFSSNWSQSFVHEARIALLPSEKPEWPDDETVKFFNPATGMTYSARSYGSETLFDYAVEKGSGARMLEWANWLLTYAYKVQRNNQGLVLIDAYGMPLFETKDGKPELDDSNPGAAAALQRYVDTIDTFRQLTATFRQALDDESLPQP